MSTTSRSLDMARPPNIRTWSFSRRTSASWTREPFSQEVVEFYCRGR